jgi:hypothetical protein
VAVILAIVRCGCHVENLKSVAFYVSLDLEKSAPDTEDPKMGHPPATDLSLIRMCNWVCRLLRSLAGQPRTSFIPERSSPRRFTLRFFGNLPISLDGMVTWSS